MELNEHRTGAYIALAVFIAAIILIATISSSAPVASDPAGRTFLRVTVPVASAQACEDLAPELASVLAGETNKPALVECIDAQNNSPEPSIASPADSGSETGGATGEGPLIPVAPRTFQDTSEEL